jgi:hypothetical protein
MLTLGPVLDVLDLAVAAVPAPAELGVVAIEHRAVHLAQRQVTERRPDMDADDAFVPGPGRRSDVEHVEVVVEELVDRGPRRRVPPLVAELCSRVLTRSASVAALGPPGTISDR